MKTINLLGNPISVSGRIITISRIQQEYEYLMDVKDPSLILDQLRALRMKIDIFTFWQRLPDTHPQFNYYMEIDNVAAIPISSYENWFYHQIHPNTRNKIRKSHRMGIEVRSIPFDDNLVYGIHDIFNETPIRQGRRFNYYGESFQTIKRKWSVDLDHSEFIGAFLGKELVGFIKLIYTDRYVRTSGTIAKICHREKAPMNALISKAVKTCADNRVPYLVYGKFDYGKKGMDSLTQFKINSGFCRYELPRYYVALTPLGKIAIQHNLHKGMINTLPRNVVLLILKARNKLAQLCIR